MLRLASLVELQLVTDGQTDIRWQNIPRCHSVAR